MPNGIKRRGTAVTAVGMAQNALNAFFAGLDQNLNRLRADLEQLAPLEPKTQRVFLHPVIEVKKANPAQQLQGRYMGLIRNLSQTDKAKVKKAYASNGVKSAIALAKTIKTNGPRNGGRQGKAK